MNTKNTVSKKIEDTKKCIGKCHLHNSFACLNCKVFAGLSENYGKREPILGAGI